MGYTTEFTGRFLLNKKLDEGTYNYLVMFNETRRIARKLDPKYGVEGELFVGGKGFMGQDREDATIIDYNRPPSTQPGLWCKWRPSEDRMGIEWDECEKFYKYEVWINYILEKFLIPQGYTLTGSVHFQGEEDSDYGNLVAEGTKVTIKFGLKKQPKPPLFKETTKTTPLQITKQEDIIANPARKISL